MALPVFDSEDEVPEAFRSLYEERDGKWHAKAEGGGADDDAALAKLQKSVERLEEALQKERGYRETAEEARKRAEDARKDLERKMSDKDHGIPEDQAKAWREEMYKEIRAEMAEELEQYKTQAEEASGRLREKTLDDRAKSIALKQGVRGDRLDKWWKLWGDRFDLDDDDGLVVRDGKGKTVEAFIAEDLKKEMPELYEGTKAEGSGAPGGFGGPTTHGGHMSADDILKDPARAVTEGRKAGAV